MLTEDEQRRKVLEREREDVTSGISQCHALDQAA